MNANLSALTGAAVAEAVQMVRSPLLIFLTIIQAVTFLLLVSIFGMTGSMAPTALINNDKGVLSQVFIEHLEKAHHSFALRPMDKKKADELLQKGELVASIIIPEGFSENIQYGFTSPLEVVVDNIDTDMTEDIQRALPSAIVSFANRIGLPDVRIHVEEHDLIDHDTGFIPYLVVSALALDGFVVAGILSGVAVAREFETGTAKILKLSPVSPIIPILGKILAIDIVAMIAMFISLGIVILGYGVVPINLFEVEIALLLSVFVFSLVGAAIGVLFKKTLPVTSLIFGLALPLYIDSGSLEPERFDGNIIWTIGHLSPIYYSVGILEKAFFGFDVTPESIFLNFLILIGWAILMLFITVKLLRRAI